MRCMCLWCLGTFWTCSKYYFWHVCYWLFPEGTKHKAASLCLVDAGHTLNSGLVSINELNGFQSMMCWTIWDTFLLRKWWKDFQVVPNGANLPCLRFRHTSHLESIYKRLRLWQSKLLLFNLYFDSKHLGLYLIIHYHINKDLI